MTQQALHVSVGADTATGGGNEWRSGWKVVFAATMGFAASLLPFGIVIGLAKPMSEMLQWSRAEVMMGFLIYPVVNLILAPTAGGLIDRYGPRKVAIIATPISLALASCLGLSGPHVWTWYLAWALFSCTAPFTSPVVWTAGVAGHFRKHQGKAIGFTLCGNGIAFAFAIPLGFLVYSEIGWRASFPIVCGIGFAVVYPILWLYFREAVSHNHSASPGDAQSGQSSAAPDMPLSEAIRTTRYWRLILSMVLAGLPLSALSLHLVSMLSDSGVPQLQAISLAALVGPSTIIGRFASAFLLDVVYAPLLGAVAFLLPVISAVILFQQVQTYEILVLAVFLIGVTSSVDIQVPAYLTPRYFGYRHYGRVFGLAFGILFVAMGIGPVMAGAIFDVTGSYYIFFIFMMISLSLSALLMATLGRYENVQSP